MSKENPQDEGAGLKFAAILSYVTCVASLIGTIWVTNATHNSQVIAPCLVLFGVSLIASMFFLLRNVKLSDNPYNDNDLY